MSTPIIMLFNALIKDEKFPILNFFAIYGDTYFIISDSQRKFSYSINLDAELSYTDKRIFDFFYAVYNTDIYSVSNLKKLIIELHFNSPENKQ